MKNGRKILRVLVGILLIEIAVVGMVWMAMQNPKNNKISKCVLNLEGIKMCKRLWENDQTNKDANVVPTWDEMRPYFPTSWSNQIPVCPSGGIYTIGCVGESPKCSVGGPRHSLPQ